MSANLNPSPEFLSGLRALYHTNANLSDLSPKENADSPWYMAAAIAFAAANRPNAVPVVFEYALTTVPKEEHTLRLQIARKVRDGVFKAGMICGFPRVINALAALHKAMPEELKDKETLRDRSMSVEQAIKQGQTYFESTYGDTTAKTQSFLWDIFPDLEYYVTSFAYGYGYAHNSVTSPVETSYAMISALIATDMPTQIAWHLAGAVRNGATPGEVRGIRNIAMTVSKEVGVVWVDEVPDVPDEGTVLDH